MLEVPVPASAVGRPDEAQPVDDRAVCGSSAESIGMTDHPGSEYPAAATTVDEHIVLIDIPLRENSVHSIHQVIEVLVGIVVLDGIAEFASVACTPAWVRV